MSFDHKAIKLCITLTASRREKMVVETSIAYYKVASSHPVSSTAK